MSAESRWCRWCQKRFAKESVFIAHLTGKKHIKALEKGGQVAEAAAIKQKLAIQKMTNQSKDALDKAKQEKAKAEGEGDPDEKKRKHAVGEIETAPHCLLLLRTDRFLSLRLKTSRRVLKSPRRQMEMTRST
eukprot:SAG31_NODE_98_length_25640_cov_9.936744_18_plen_132_part_00